MGHAHTVIAAHQRGQGKGFGSGKGRIPPCAVLHRFDRLPIGILILVGRPLADKLLASLRVLALAKLGEVLGRDRAGEPKLRSEPALPLAGNYAALRPITLLFGGEFFLMIVLGLARRKWLGYSQHVSKLRSEGKRSLTFLWSRRRLTSFAPTWGTLDFTSRQCTQDWSRRDGRANVWLLTFFLWCPYDEIVLKTFDESRLACRELQRRERKPGNVISVLQVSVQVVQTADLRVKDQGLGLPVEREISPRAASVKMGFLHALDLHFSDGSTDPFSGVGLGGLQ